MRPNISSAAHYRGAGGDYSCRQGHEQTFQGFMGSNFEKGVSLIFLNRVGRVSLPLCSRNERGKNPQDQNWIIVNMQGCFFFSQADCLMGLDWFPHGFINILCFHTLTVITIEFFNLNHQCQTQQHVICSVYVALLTLSTAILQTFY